MRCWSRGGERSYLTGFTGTTVSCCCSGTESRCSSRIPDTRSSPRKRSVPDGGGAEKRTDPRGGEAPEEGPGRRPIGFDKVHLTFAAYEKLESELGGACKARSGGRPHRSSRMVKTPEELAGIREFRPDHLRAFEAALKAIKPGVTESRLAATIEDRMRRFGAEKPSFDTIVAAGERTALPHARPTDQRLQGNELVLIDMGALRHGYASDMTRTLYLGRPSPKVRRMYGAVLEAQLAGIAAIRPGATAEQVDRALPGRR